MNKLISTNPAKNYQVLGEVEISSQDEIALKVKHAQQAKDEWRSRGLKGRVELLRQLSKNILKRQKDISLLSTQEMGMPITQSSQDVLDALNYFNWYLDNAEKYLLPERMKEGDEVHRVFYEPIGVAAVIVPWNFPMSNFVWGVGQNLIVGNTVVFKESEEIPLVGKLIEEIIYNTKLPEGVFSEIYGGGSVGDSLVHDDIDLINFTGSTNVGRYLYKVASEKFIKIVMELGGSAPGIIFEDADIDTVLDTLYFSRFTNSGQMCDGLKRLIVHKEKFEEVIEKLKKKLQATTVGNPEIESTDFGPLVAKRQLELLEDQVKDATIKGAKIVIGGKRPRDLEGAYYEPTILSNITQDMRVWREEVFGPVLPILPFKTEKEAVDLANDTMYGLGSYIFTCDKERAERVSLQIEAGMVAVNNVSYSHPFNPFGGYKNSGIGREHGKYGFHELTQVKVVSMEE